MAGKRVLIIYATAGAGHKKAAMAIEKAFNIIGPGADVDMIDSLDYTNPFFRWFYPRVYIFLVNRAPSLWGLGYYLLDNKSFYSVISWIRHAANWINSRPLAGFLREKNYDVIISTHFLAPDVIYMEGRNRIKSFLINVITDFRSHSFWITKRVDMYVTAHKKAEKDLISRYHIPPEKIKVLGLPIDPVFSKQKDKEALLKKLGLEKAPFTVLIGSGGFGVGPIIELVKSFKGISVPARLIVVCGKNEDLRASVDRLRGDIGLPVKSYGYVDNIDELMEVSDVIITKTGGMMTSEALSRGLPIIALAPIPGQETRNFRVLVEEGVALDPGDIKGVARNVERLYNDKVFMASLRDKIEFIKRPEAAYDIVRLAMASRICPGRLTCYGEA